MSVAQIGLHMWGQRHFLMSSLGRKLVCFIIGALGHSIIMAMVQCTYIQKFEFEFQLGNVS